MKMAKATDTEWETVAEGARTSVAFENIGDKLIGIYAGTQPVTDEAKGETWDQYLFDDCEYPEDVAGENVAVNAGYDLRKALDQIEPHKFLVSVEYVRNIPMKTQPAPMKGFRVLRKAL
jgi:hypothetical protein